MIKIINLVGARPQFVKAAMISKVLSHKYTQLVDEIVVHSGQHYDYNLSDVFFTQLGIPTPKYHLDSKAKTGQEQVEFIKEQFAEVLRKEQPNAVIVYGDTNTTRAGALAASAVKVPIAHIEAGLRSYNQTMPEELNRVITDKLSSFLFVPTSSAVKNLEREDIFNVPTHWPKVEVVGDIMIDSLRVFGAQAQLSNSVAKTITGKPLMLVTIHRNYNADDPKKLHALIAALEEQTNQYQVVFPVHPRTAKGVKTTNSAITFLPPISYFDMLALLKQASLILTDSGGVQKEAYYFEKPMVILRSETEWVELIEAKLAVLSGVSSAQIKTAIAAIAGKPYPAKPGIYGDGFAAERICKTLVEQLA